MENYDILIIGAGPAGLSAGLYAGRQNSKALILDKGLTGGLGLEVPMMENYPGFEAISGLDLIVKMKNQTEKFCEIREHIMIKSIKKQENGFLLEIKSIHALEEKYDEIFAKSIILATGASHRHLNVPGEEEFLGRGVSYCATCDGMFFTGRDVLMIGGGNSAAQEAIFLKNLGANVKLVHSGRKLRCDTHLLDLLNEKEIPIILNARPKEIKGNMMIESVVLNINGVCEIIAILFLNESLFIFIISIPSILIVPMLGSLWPPTSFKIVVLPEPLTPTIATVVPASILKLILSNTLTLLPLSPLSYVNDTFLNSISPLASLSSIFPSTSFVNSFPSINPKDLSHEIEKFFLKSKKRCTKDTKGIEMIVK